MSLLRDGSWTADARCAALQDTDPRSRQFELRQVDGETDFSSGTRGWAPATSFDQGRTGACVAAAWAHVLTSAPWSRRDLTWKYVLREIYWQAQKIDRWPGGEYPGAKPISGGTSVLAVAKTLQEKGLIQRYLWAQSVEQLVWALMMMGPLVVAVSWYEGMQSAGEKMVPAGRLLGRHCLAATGVRATVDSRHRLIRDESWIQMTNSTGHDWGRAGASWITLADLRQVWGTAEACLAPREAGSPSDSQVTGRVGA